MLAASHPVGAIGGRQQGLHLVAGQRPNPLLVCTLPGDGYHTRRDRDARGVPSRHNPNERPQGGQAKVPGTDGMPAVVFPGVKQGEDRGGVQTWDTECGRLNPDGLVHKGQQETARVAATRNRLRADAFLVAEVDRAKGLYVGRNARTGRRHEASPSAAYGWNRRAAALKSARVAVRYQ
jgi:hypothetical protein